MGKPAFSEKQKKNKFNTCKGLIYFENRRATKGQTNNAQLHVNR